MFALGGGVLGFLLTVALLTLAKGAVRLCLAGCHPKRAWPDCWLWKKVRLKLHPTPSWKQTNPSFVLQVSDTKALVNDVEEVRSDTVDLNSSG